MGVYARNSRSFPTTCGLIALRSPFVPSTFNECVDGRLCALAVTKGVDLDFFSLHCCREECVRLSSCAVTNRLRIIEAHEITVGTACRYPSNSKSPPMKDCTRVSGNEKLSV